MSEIKICKECKKLNMKSILTVQHMHCSHAISEPKVESYDQEGNLIKTPTHYETCEMNQDVFNCSNGHMYSEKRNEHL